MFLNSRLSLPKVSIGCAAFSLFSMAAASAQIETETFTTTAPLQGSQAFTLPDFDPSLGTLESVDLTLTLSDSASIQVYNVATSPVSFTNATLSLVGSLTGPGSLDFTTPITSEVTSGTAQPGLNTYAAAPVANSASDTVAPNELNLWEDQAGSLVNLSYTQGDATYHGTELGHSNLYFGGTSAAAGSVSVVYTFESSSDAAPEPPGKYFSMIVACALVGILARRRVLSVS